MAWLYLLLVVFALLTVAFVYGDYKKGSFTKKAFVIVCILESVVAVGSVVLFAMSFR